MAKFKIGDIVKSTTTYYKILFIDLRLDKYMVTNLTSRSKFPVSIGTVEDVCVLASETEVLLYV